MDDEDRDPDFNPNKEFIEPDDMVIDDEDEEDTFQVQKHSHTLKFFEKQGNLWSGCEESWKSYRKWYTEVKTWTPTTKCL